MIQLSFFLPLLTPNQNDDQFRRYKEAREPGNEGVQFTL